MGKSLEWLGGFFEGEGSIIIEHRKSDRWPNRIFYRKLRLSASQKFGKPLEFFQEKFGGSLTYAPNNGMYHWVVSDKNAARVLQLIKEHLVIKQMEAELALLHRNTLTQVIGKGSSKIFSEWDFAELNSFGEAFKEIHGR